MSAKEHFLIEQIFAHAFSDLTCIHKILKLYGKVYHYVPGSDFHDIFTVCKKFSVEMNTLASRIDNMKYYQFNIIIETGLYIIAMKIRKMYAEYSSK